MRAAAIELPRGICINAVNPSVEEESLDVFGASFRGFEAVPASRVALAYSRSVEGRQTGRGYAFGSGDKQLATQCLRGYFGHAGMFSSLAYGATKPGLSSLSSPMAIRAWAAFLTTRKNHEGTEGGMQMMLLTGCSGTQALRSLVSRADDIFRTLFCQNQL